MRTLLWTSLWASLVNGIATREPGTQFPLRLPEHRPTKRVAVVGLGAGGITALKALAELPERLRDGLDIVAFEQREAVGGLWVPDDNVPLPPALPKTPLYPSLRTNGPHALVTIPRTPFAPETPLLAHHQQVLRYYQDIVSSSNLSPYIRLQHAVHSARWIGTPAAGHWQLTVENVRHGTTEYYEFDHLVVAPGFNHFPTYPHFDGQEEWLATNRTITHCMYYRDPSIFAGQNIVVVGGGPSGWDMARHIAPHAKSLYWSRDTKEERPESPVFPDVPNALNVARIASLSNGTVTLRDGTKLHDIDTLVLATGYDVRVPFLDHLVEGKERPADRYRLSTNFRYIRPLYEHTLSLDDSYPLGALYFCGILSYNPTGMTNYAQALFAAYTIADPSLLLGREEFYSALVEREERIRGEGFDPNSIGHKVVQGYGRFSGYLGEGPFEDLMVNFIRERGRYAGYPGIPPTGLNYTERWRIGALKYAFELVQAWYAGLEEEGEAWDRRWSEGRWSESDYLAVIYDVMTWWEKFKKGKQKERLS